MYAFTRMIQNFDLYITKYYFHYYYLVTSILVAYRDRVLKNILICLKDLLRVEVPARYFNVTLHVIGMRELC